MVRTSLVFVAVTAISIVLGWGCSTSDDRLGVENEKPPAFTGEAGVVDADRGLTLYCATNKCPPGWTTCPGSRFPCDVNLQTDVKNCGACDVACPSGSGNEEFSCIAGACSMQCTALSRALDCDGLADTGCEVSGADNENCGACGKRCPDPAKPCVGQSASGAQVDCGCPPDTLYCSGRCVDHQRDDRNCGRCENVCDPTGDGAPSYPHSYYGCRDAHCGVLKCMPRFDDCDSKVANGCETNLVTPENCGACGHACPAGQGCYLDLNMEPRCMCPEGLTLCKGGPDRGSCVDLTADIYNCGSCGAECRSLVSTAQLACNYGACVMRCNGGQADCNNDPSDGCEVDIGSDPRNCGGCGQSCDLVVGQACVAGRCIVEPCGDDAGGGVAR